MLSWRDNFNFCCAHFHLQITPVKEWYNSKIQHNEVLRLFIKYQSGLTSRIIHSALGFTRSSANIFVFGSNFLSPTMNMWFVPILVFFIESNKWVASATAKIGRTHGLARTIKESFYIRVNNPPLIGILVNTILIIYGTESYLTPPTLKLTLSMGMHIEHTLVAMLGPFQPIGI